MIKPIEFPEQNTVYKGANCSDLPAWTDGTQIVSCWKLEPEDIEAITASGQIWLHIHAPIQTPIALHSAIPFIDPTQWPDPDKELEYEKNEMPDER